MVRCQVHDGGDEIPPAIANRRRISKAEVVHEGVLHEIIRVDVSRCRDARNTVKVVVERVEPAVVIDIVGVQELVGSGFSVHLTHRDTGRRSFVTSTSVSVLMNLPAMRAKRRQPIGATPARFPDRCAWPSTG